MNGAAKAKPFMEGISHLEVGACSLANGIPWLRVHAVCKSEAGKADTKGVEQLTLPTSSGVYGGQPISPDSWWIPSGYPSIKEVDLFLALCPLFLSLDFSFLLLPPSKSRESRTETRTSTHHGSSRIQKELERMELLHLLHGLSGPDSVWVSCLHYWCHFGSAVLPHRYGPP